jgi:hypothetical protein
MKRFSTSLTIRKIQNYKHNKMPLYTQQKAEIKKMIYVFSRMWSNQLTLLKEEKLESLWETAWQYILCISYDSVIIFLCVFPSEICTYGHQKSCTWIFGRSTVHNSSTHILMEWIVAYSYNGHLAKSCYEQDE